MQNRFSAALGAVLIGVLAIAAAPVRAAIPGHPNNADLQAIEACLADAAKAKADPHTCVGRVANDCIIKAPTPAAAQECSNRELLVWDTALNHDYTRLLALLTTDAARQAMRDVQREFFVWKLKKCTFERTAHGNNVAGAAAATHCEAKATADQDLWLVDQINSFSSH